MSCFNIIVLNKGKEKPNVINIIEIYVIYVLNRYRNQKLYRCLKLGLNDGNPNKLIYLTNKLFIILNFCTFIRIIY